MGEMRDSDWSRENLLRSDWLVLQGATITTQEKVLNDILQRKNAFLGYKNKKLKSRKIDIFPKGLTHGFGPKMAIFRTFFFRQLRPRKCLL